MSMRFLIASLIILFVTKVSAQVNLQTGSATYSLPIFNWQDDKSRLSTGVSINYNSGSGLKVNDVASSVGQGWNLIAGGMITRIQVGQPDDQKPFEGTGDLNIYKYPPGYLYNDKVEDGVPKEVCTFPLFSSPNQVYAPYNTLTADTELDYFSFQFNGRGGIFVLGKNNGYKGSVIGDSKLVVWYDPPAENMQTADNVGIRTTIDVFYIKDENGIVYKYSKHGLTKVLKSHLSKPDITTPISQTNAEDCAINYETDFDEIPASANPYIISNWYLTEISDPLSHKSIFINYIERAITTTAGDIISTTVDNTKTVTSAQCVAQFFTDQRIMISHKMSISKTQSITSIITPDNQSVLFKYDDDQRVDLNGDYPLKSIDIKSNGELVNTYRIGTTYFVLNQYKTPVTAAEKSKARLCLKEVQKVGLDSKTEEPPYVFDYYLGSNTPGDFVPPPFYYLKDIGGYYNGDKYNSLYVNDNFEQLNHENLDLIKIHTYETIPFFNDNLPPNNQSQLYGLSFIQLRALCYYRLKWPECRIATNCNSSQISPHSPQRTIKEGYAKNGLLMSITNPLGGKLSYEYEQNAQGVFTYAIGLGVHVSRTIESDGGYSNGIDYETGEVDKPIITTYEYIDNDGRTSQWGEEEPVNVLYTDYSYRATGGYQYGGILSKEDITDVPATNNLKSSLNIIALTNAAMNVSLQLSTGIIVATTGTAALINPYVWIEVIMVKIFLDAVNSQHENYIAGGFSYICSNYNLSQINPYPVLFKRVEMSKVAEPLLDADGIITYQKRLGKTVYEFTSDVDYPLWGEKFGGAPKPAIEQQYFHPYSIKQRAAFWAYGLPKKIITYDNVTNQKINETEYEYDWSDSKLKHPISENVSYNTFVRNSISMPYEEIEEHGVIPGWENFSDPTKLNYTKSTVMEYYGGICLTTQKMINIDAYKIYSGRVELKNKYERIYKPGDDTKYQETKTSFEYNPNNFQPKKISTLLTNGDERIKEIYYPEDYTAPGFTNDFKNNNIVNTPIAIYEALKKSGNLNASYLSANVTDYTIVSGNTQPKIVYSGRSLQPVTGFTFNASNPFSYPNILNNPTNFYYDAKNNFIGMKDEGNRVTTNIYDYNNKFIVATIKNADPNVDNCAYTSFETNNFFDKWVSAVNVLAQYPNPYIANKYVTGSKSFDLNTNTLSSPSLNAAKAYKLSFWATSNVNINVLNGTATNSIQAPTINGFTYYEYDISKGATSLALSGNVLIDELRLYPKSAHMTTVSYNPTVGKTSECDENNRIKYYDYDGLGRLIKISNERRDVIKAYEYHFKLN